MNPADIWTTLLLPTLVTANNPAFSLQYKDSCVFEKKKYIYIYSKSVSCDKVCLHRHGCCVSCSKESTEKNPKALLKQRKPHKHWHIFKDFNRGKILCFAIYLPTDSTAKHRRWDWRCTCIPWYRNVCPCGLFPSITTKNQTQEHTFLKWKVDRERFSVRPRQERQKKQPS